MKPNLIVIAGPTASGKTALAVNLANAIHSEILSADSRQVYKEMTIGTAVPNADELSAARHHLIQHISIQAEYDVSIYEEEALHIISHLHGKMKNVILCGGSGLYIDAVCTGFDELPAAIPELREELQQAFEHNGLEYLQRELQRIDPEFYLTVDKQNPVRLMRAIEVYRITGTPYSTLRRGRRVERPFCIQKYLLDLPREQLFKRIDARVDRMIDQGLVDEARTLYPFRELKALKTVGYRELFAHFDGDSTLDHAIEKIKVNSRRYAKRQMTWFKRDSGYQLIDPEKAEQFIEKVNQDIED